MKHSNIGSAPDPTFLDRILVRYLRSREHPMKRRIERLLLNAAGKRTLRCTDNMGLQYEASPWECVQSNILRAGSYEPESLALLRQLLRPGDVMVDVGANVGEFTLSAASIVGSDGRVIAVEASPVIYESLRRNIALNRFSNVLPVLVAASSKDGIVTFGELPQHNWGMNRRSQETNGATRVAGTTVAARTIESILRDCYAQRCDVMKIDVEGMEFEVLDGIDFNGKRRPRHIILECIPELQTSVAGNPALLSKMLVREGYELCDVRGRAATAMGSLIENNVWARDMRVTETA